MSDIPPETLALLSSGELETANLVEFLAVDVAALAKAAERRFGFSGDARFFETLAELPREKPMKRHSAVAAEFVRLASAQGDPVSAGTRLSSSPSDVVRGWGALAFGMLGGISAPQALDFVRPLAADRHFGVRETAWMSLRDRVVREREGFFPILAGWVSDPDPNVRRFVCELTRPRGVWCAQFPDMRARPELGLPIVGPLRADASKYVRDSVANWLNDASKDHPEWVVETCRGWWGQSPSEELAYVVRRALRTVSGNGKNPVLP